MGEYGFILLSAVKPNQVMFSSVMYMKLWMGCIMVYKERIMNKFRKPKVILPKVPEVFIKQVDMTSD